MKTFWIRTASAAVYALLFMGSIFSGHLTRNHDLGVIILTIFALFVTLGCAVEYFRMAEIKGAKPNKSLGFFFCVVATLCLCLPGIMGLVVAAVLALIVFLSLPITLMIQLWRESEHPFADVLHTLLPTFYCAIPLGLMPFINEQNVLAVCVLLVWSNDCFAYIGGSLVGKHKMWPKHSPGKTWEGTAIGVACCMAVAFFLGPLFNPEVSWAAWIAMGLVCGIVGTLGDLVESMLKRSCGVKDSGNIMPGHGGFLDRFDSLLMILPFVLLIVIFL